MGPKINGSSVAELVSAMVDRQLEKKLYNYNNLLTGALAKIASLEEELARCQQNSNKPFPIIKSDICRHWLRNQCTWQQKCRFSHGGAASSTASMSDSIAKDFNEVVTQPKGKEEKSIQVGVPFGRSSSSSTCTVPLPCSDLPSRPSFVAGVLQPELVDAALSYSIADSLVEDLLSAVVSVAKKPVPVVVKGSSPVTGPFVPVSKDEEWVDTMLEVIEKLETKYGAKYKPINEGGDIHSAQVAIPRIDFCQVKPHLHKKLPKPTLIPVQACSMDPAVYTKCTGALNCTKDYDGLKHKHAQPHAHFDHDSRSEFTGSQFPFGALPGFVTSLGVVAVPDEPIGGYIYAGGAGDATVWQLHAEAVFL